MIGDLQTSKPTFETGGCIKTLAFLKPKTLMTIPKKILDVNLDYKS